MSDKNLQWQAGRVESVRLSKDRGCFLCLWLAFDFGGSGQAFGGHVLWNEANPTDPSAAGLDYVSRVMTVCQAEELFECCGSYLEVGRESHLGEIVAIRCMACDGDSSFDYREWRRRWFGDQP